MKGKVTHAHTRPAGAGEHFAEFAPITALGGTIGRERAATNPHVTTEARMGNGFETAASRVPEKLHREAIRVSVAGDPAPRAGVGGGIAKRPRQPSG